MKILLTTSSFNGGGIASYAHELINNYSHDNDFYVMIGTDKKSPILQKNVNIFYYDVTNINIRNLKRILYVINNIIQPDIILNSFAPAISILSPYLNNNIKIIAVSHSLKYIEAEIAGINHQYVDHIIALSNFGKTYLLNKFKIKKEKVSVIYNFVQELPKAKEYLEEKRKNDITKIVFPGGCAGSKTPELILQVVRELLKTNLKFEFYWLGGSTIHLSRHFPILGLSDISYLLPKDSRLHITGKIPREEATNILASTNIFLFPSRREGCPMSLIEAMRVGAICIVSDFDNANKEIINDKENGFVINHNYVGGFTTLITDIITNPIPYNKFYEASYNSYKNNLSFDIWKVKMNKVLFNLENNHTERKKHPNIIKLQLDIIKFKIRSLICKVQVTLEEDIKVLIAIYKLKKQANG